MKNIIPGQRKGLVASSRVRSMMDAFDQEMGYVHSTDPLTLGNSIAMKEGKVE